MVMQRRTTEQRNVYIEEKIRRIESNLRLICQAIERDSASLDEERLDLMHQHLQAQVEAAYTRCRAALLRSSVRFSLSDGKIDEAVHDQ